jgi:hypothetical protein
MLSPWGLWLEMVSVTPTVTLVFAAAGAASAAALNNAAPARKAFRKRGVDPVACLFTFVSPHFLFDASARQKSRADYSLS